MADDKNGTKPTAAKQRITVADPEQRIAARQRPSPSDDTAAGESLADKLAAVRAVTGDDRHGPDYSGAMAAQSPQELDVKSLIFDWNEFGRKGRIIPQEIEFFDETLRDGLQNPSVEDPTIEAKLELLHHMADLGIHVADIGLPGSSQRAFDDMLRMCKEITRLVAQGRISNIM